MTTNSEGKWRSSAFLPVQSVATVNAITGYAPPIKVLQVATSTSLDSRPHGTERDSSLAAASLGHPRGCGEATIGTLAPQFTHTVSTSTNLLVE
jgi:hypothetical protein